MTQNHSRGDERQLTEYAATAGGIVAGNGGRRLGTSAPAWTLAIFDGPGRAIRCARALLDAAIAKDIAAGAGLHCGEVGLVSGEPVGVTVDIARDVARQAGPGEVVVTRTVRDLVVGSPLSFRELGTFDLRRIAEAWALFALQATPASVRPTPA